MARSSIELCTEGTDYMTGWERTKKGGGCSIPVDKDKDKDGSGSDKDRDKHKQHKSGIPVVQFCLAHGSHGQSRAVGSNILILLSAGVRMKQF